VLAHSRRWADPSVEWAAARYLVGVPKRLFDGSVAAVLIIVLLPLLVLIAVAVVVDTPGSPFYRQARRGRGGREFRIVKFRTMHREAEAAQCELAESNDAEWPLFKIKGRDCRATRVGHVLRRTSLDELPQLWNVLVGEMSLVGPRPLAVAEADRLSAAAQRRLEARPGITGLWQATGRHRVGTSEMIALDLSYVDRCSFSLDLAILVKTVPAVVTGRGAY
jgi:lipopolysaccharide/colanic/teichoic acid biosynthesis glycosyltransferase